VHRVRCLRRKAHYCTTPEAATYVAGAVPVIRRLLQAGRYDVTHAHFILPDGFLAWRIRRSHGLPYVITAHGSDVPGYNPDRLRAAHKLLRPLWTSVTRDAARVVCPSETLRELVTLGSAEARTLGIPNGIDPCRFSPTRQKAKRILVATRILKRKGVQYLLEALEGVPLEHEVWIVGDGPYLPTLRSAAERMRLPVRFRGWLDNNSREFKELLETSDIFVLPSESENFPIALLEAMAAGMAIVTTEGTGCAEVVGDAALLVRPRDAEGIRGALGKLVHDPALRNDLGRAARRRLEERFSWRRVGGQYEDLLKSIARNGHPNGNGKRHP
jgi:glycosyltransferase involved in cell wall biosynthesis